MLKIAKQSVCSVGLASIKLSMCDDIDMNVFQVIMLVSTAALDESCASLLCKADILLGLIELLKGWWLKPLLVHLH